MSLFKGKNMKIKIIGLVAGLALIGCQPDKKPTPAPVPVTPAPKAQSQVTTPVTKPQSQAAALTSAPQSVATKVPDDVAALAKSLFEDQEQVAYSSSKNKIVYAEAYQQEGTGAGLNIVFVGVDGTGREDLEVYTPEEDSEAKSKTMLPKILERLTGEGYTPLTKTEWPEKQEKVSPFGGLDVSWKNNEIIAARAGEGPNIERHKIKAEKPFKDRPLAVYSSNTSPVFIVKIEHDPGDKYSEGFNLHTTYEVFPMPQVASK
jgi:hypothetical protein